MCSNRVITGAGDGGAIGGTNDDDRLLLLLLQYRLVRVWRAFAHG